MNDKNALDVPVLIVGGGPVGLTASLLLSRFGIESLLVERHSGTAILPKARAINARTMEMYRQLGLADDIRNVGMDPKFGRMILWAESLAGAEIKRLEPSRGSDSSKSFSPVKNCGCAQDVLEPVLRRHAERAGLGRLMFSTAFTDMEYSRDGVIGKLTEDKSDVSKIVRARYVIAADGAQSKIREQIGAQMFGERDVYDSVNIHFRADLTQWIKGRPAALYLIEQSDLRGTFLTINGTTRWSFLVTSLSAYGYSAAQFTPEFASQIIRKAVGTDLLDIEILGIGAWKASAVVADKYRDASVFLAGDAAHEMPPTGGLGLNTGVQDVQNLAWKIAAVLKQEAGDGLLDSYEAERRPLGVLTTESSLLNALSMGRRTRQAVPVLPRDAYLKEVGIVFGFRYESNAVVSDNEAPVGTVQSVTEYEPTAYPGCRAPHVRIVKEGAELSTIDLFGTGFVLLAGKNGHAWKAAVQSISKIKVQCFVTDTDIHDVDQELHTVFGINPDGAVLVRPDGIVGWRKKSAADASSLENALDRILNITNGGA